MDSSLLLCVCVVYTQSRVYGRKGRKEKGDKRGKREWDRGREGGERERGENGIGEGERVSVCVCVCV